uniref:Uncharacterized protein n=1 Tax=Rangifer tarandus platyrhynchus TaxID=3082113 RepID=A0ACB0EC96_RANTA|nr:unnamed protein product [Rangifer tarandus platyrhynchus]
MGAVCLPGGVRAAGAAALLCRCAFCRALRAASAASQMSSLFSQNSRTFQVGGTLALCAGPGSFTAGVSVHAGLCVVLSSLLECKTPGSTRSDCSPASPWDSSWHMAGAPQLLVTWKSRRLAPFTVS